MLKVLELFSGVGSFSLALKALEIEHEVVGYSDIRPTAVRLFSKLHNIPESDNLGDIKNIDATSLDVDLITFGSPCQSFSRTGRGAGGVKGSNTPSSLMWEAVRIMKETNPKWIVWENVPDAISKKHLPNFQEYMAELDDMSYNTYYEVLNSHELGSAQKRRRLFAVSVRKDIDNGSFSFNKIKLPPKKLSGYLEPYNESMEVVTDSVYKELVLGETSEGYKIKNGTKLGYLIANDGDAIDLGFPTSKTRRGRVQKEMCQTLLRSKSIGTIQNRKLRYLTPLEYWRLQEMPEQFYDSVIECNFSLNETYDVVGGVINQLHLKTLFTSMSDAFEWERII